MGSVAFNVLRQVLVLSLHLTQLHTTNKWKIISQLRALLAKIKEYAGLAQNGTSSAARLYGPAALKQARPYCEFFTYIGLTLLFVALCLRHDVICELLWSQILSELAPLLELERLVLDQVGVRLELESLFSRLDRWIRPEHVVSACFSNEINFIYYGSFDRIY